MFGQCCHSTEQALAKMLTVNETLTSLDLAGRWRGRLDIGNQGAQARLVTVCMAARYKPPSMLRILGPS